MTIDYARSIPILASLNTAETAAFYTKQLGFKAGYLEDHYIIVTRDEIELHFWKTDDPRFPENAACYIRGGQVAALHAEFMARRIPRVSPFEVRPWNMKEFYVHDPHGNLLKFGSGEW